MAIVYKARVRHPYGERPGASAPWRQCGVMVLVVWASFCQGYEGSSFATIHQVISEQPYQQLPSYEVSGDLFGGPGSGVGNKLRAAAHRTLTTKADLLAFPAGQKLFQPNGICFTGHWRVTNDSIYGGFFKNGSHGLMVMRASVSLGETRRGAKRAFALAGKLFPTLDPHEVVRTANFFAMETLVGTTDAHFLDAVLDNNPPTGGVPGSFTDLLLALRVRKDFVDVARELGAGGSDPAYRSVSAIAALGNISAEPPAFPHWMALRVAQDTPRVDQNDFRDELRLEHYPGHRLVWEIRVAAYEDRGKQHAQWQRIGDIALDDYMLTKTCDARLHFAHPAN